MARFLRLLRKDLETSKWPLGILSGITVGLVVFVRLRFQAHTLPGAPLAAVVLAIPPMFLPFWLLWQSFQSLRSEWREDTVYTLLVLPVPGWQITLSKLLGICIEYTVLLFAYLGSLLLLFHQYMAELFQAVPSLSWLAWNGFLAYLISLVVLGTVVVFVQAAFVVGKMVGRLQGLVALWVLFLATWLTGKLGMILEPVFRWLPPLPVHKILRLDELGREIILEWNLASQIGSALGVLALFALTGFLIEHYVEING